MKLPTAILAQSCRRRLRRPSEKLRCRRVADAEFRSRVTIAKRVNGLARHLDFARRRAEQQAAQRDRLTAVDSFHHPHATTIRPRWRGEPFDLHACVQALFTIKLPEQNQDLDQQAA